MAGATQRKKTSVGGFPLRPSGRRIPWTPGAGPCQTLEYRKPIRKLTFGKATKERAAGEERGGNLPATPGSQPNRRQHSPPEPPSPRPIKAPPLPAGDSPNAAFMSKPRPGEGACDCQPGKRWREERPEPLSGLDITSLCESAGPASKQGCLGGGKAGGVGGRFGPSGRRGSGFESRQD